MLNYRDGFGGFHRWTVYVTGGVIDLVDEAIGGSLWKIYLDFE
jgi:hypothetical protein